MTTHPFEPPATRPPLVAGDGAALFPAGAARPGAPLPLPGADGAPGPRTWRIEMPAGMALINSNDRKGHWGYRQRLTDALRLKAGWLAREQRIPRLERAHILAVYQPPDRRRRDPANLYPSVKACVDGIVADAGVLADDDAAHLDGPDMRLGGLDPERKGRLVLIITEGDDR